MRIISQIDDETFIISLKDTLKSIGTERIIMAHDYLRIMGTDGLYSDAEVCKKTLTGRHAWAANVISIPVDVTIGIKSAQRVLLPFLQKHKYMQPEHLADRVHDEDDKYWNADFNKHLNLTGPRYRKGDKYPAYSYTNEIMEYWENGELMVEFSLSGEKNYSKMTKKAFDQYVRPTLLKNE